ncbi:hypothetical protein [Flagellimonas beolgyonensis]|jgi:hypothetical protein|uniref:hypothetical protein n=1 Tax=Flagellimonas beolgyonensis TaxID=864064 RepID=UPI000F8EB577|nr:hypothetical protein [Allomuricauda beolgyonensis]
MKRLKYKNSNRTIWTIILVVCLGAVYMSAQKSGATINGNWRLDYEKSYAEVVPEIKMQMDTIPEFKAKVREMFVGRQFEINDAGVYKHKLSNGQVLQGSWQLNGPIMVLKDAMGNTDKQRILLLTESTLVIEPILSGDAKPLIPRYYFTKN